VSTREFFDRQARRYDRVYDERSRAGRVVRARLEAALRALGDGPGDVLDAGAASGRLAAELERRGWSVTGIDVSPEMIALARERVPRATLEVARLERLPFPDSSFDAAAATGVIEYVDDVGVALRELHRVLRPGGRAAISFPDYRAPHNAWRRLLLYPAVRAVKSVVPFGRPAPQPWRHPISTAELERRLRDAGFRVRHADRGPGGRQVVYSVEK
jgi:ubiquinone/menaquinone biosynthesis C-methylase UbiE